VKVNYCDLCGKIMKINEKYVLYIAEPNDIEYENTEDYLRYLKRVESGVKEVCPSCKHIFDKIFEYRLQGLSKMTVELEHLFKLPTIKSTKERKNKGKKK